MPPSPDGPQVRVLDFIDTMSDAYAAADVVVCRAGATSIAELTVLGIPAVLVPTRTPPATTRPATPKRSRRPVARC